MTIQKLAYGMYYALAASIVASQVAFTLYQASLTVGNGQKLQNLQDQKHQLVAQQQKLQVVVAGHLSLAELDNDQLNAYEAISSPIVIAVDTSIAAAE